MTIPAFIQQMQRERVAKLDRWCCVLCRWWNEPDTETCDSCGMERRD